jgi:hypothetical protein
MSWQAHIISRYLCELLGDQDLIQGLEFDLETLYYAIQWLGIN